MLQSERLVAFIALVGAISTVQEEMSGQTVFQSKRLPALRTDMRTFAGVNPYVRCQVVFEKESFAAFFARVRALFDRLRFRDGLCRNFPSDGLGCDCVQLMRRD